MRLDTHSEVVSVSLRERSQYLANDELRSFSTPLLALVFEIVGEAPTRLFHIDADVNELAVVKMRRFAAVLAGEL